MVPQVRFRVVGILFGLALISCDPAPEPQTQNNDQSLESEPWLAATSFLDVQIELGRTLFYDPKLSINNTIACASCHKQQYAFGDNVARSKGFDGELTIRNTLPLVDIRPNRVVSAGSYSSNIPVGGVFWDGRRFEVREAVVDPIVNHLEMGMPNLEALRDKLQQVSYYPPMFMKAFGTDNVTVSRIQVALTAFVSIMNSRTSRFERSRAGQVTLTPSEEKGRQLFTSTYNCAKCHQGVLNSNASVGFASIGLKDPDDQGLALTTHASNDQFRFRIPTLDNVGLTAPYMHDGSLATLEDVIDHYSKGIEKNRNVDPSLGSDLGAIALISDDEKKALIDFLLTLTDTDITTDPRFSDPFKSK
jgi:cytochrome c peroxidase